jgi:steroid 5-alpha reductase family enzyme
LKKSDRNALLTFPALILIGLSFSFVAGQTGPIFIGIPLFVFLAGFCFFIQWIVFIPAYLLQSEKFFDLTGSFTYIVITSFALLFSKKVDARSIILCFLVIIWAARLGVFLFIRVQKVGKDERFDELKTSFFRFLNVWTIQGLWVIFTAAAALVAISSNNRKGLGLFASVGFLLWVIGFTIEVIADLQKSRFSRDPENKGKFIQSGLWALSRHPNYFGEIMIWVGISILSLPALKGSQLIALISPIFVTLLLTRVSGVPLLEKKANQKWGGQKHYEDYKKRTPVLIPKFK